MVTAENERLLSVLRDRERELDQLRVYTVQFSDMDKKLQLYASENERMARALRDKEAELD